MSKATRELGERLTELIDKSQLDMCRYINKEIDLVQASVRNCVNVVQQYQDVNASALKKRDSELTELWDVIQFNSVGPAADRITRFKATHKITGTVGWGSTEEKAKESALKKFKPEELPGPSAGGLDAYRGYSAPRSAHWTNYTKNMANYPFR